MNAEGAEQVNGGCDFTAQLKPVEGSGEWSGKDEVIDRRESTSRISEIISKR